MIDLWLDSVEQRHLAGVMGKDERIRLFCVHFGTLDIDEGINTPAYWTSFIHLEPSEETRVVELMRTLQFEAFLADLAVG